MNRILVAITYSTCQHDHENDAEDGANKVHKDVILGGLKHFGSPLQTFQTISPLTPLNNIPYTVAKKGEYKAKLCQGGRKVKIEDGNWISLANF